MATGGKSGRCGAAAAFLAAAFSFGLLFGATPARAADPAELEMWQSVKNSEFAEELQVFLDAYPDSAFAPLARLGLKRLLGETDEPKQAEGTAGRMPDAGGEQAGTTARPPDAAPAASAVPAHRPRAYAGFRVGLAPFTLEEIASPAFRPAIRIMEVFPFGKAATAGVEANDIVTEIDGYRPKSVADFVARITARKPGETIVLSIDRDGRKMDIPVEVGDAFELAWRGAESGDGMAMALLAQEYLAGTSVDADRDAARRWLERIDKSASGYALYMRGILEERTLAESGAEKAAEAALPWHRAAAEAGVPEAMRSVARLVDKSDPDAALEMDRRTFAADPGQGAAGLYNRLSELKRTSFEGRPLMEILKAGALHGGLGPMVTYGQELMKSAGAETMRRGYRLIEQAALWDAPYAQYELGLLLKNGKGVARDGAQAVNWFRKAADANHAAAQSQLGIAYYYGRGVTKDPRTAFQWFERAARSGDALGNFYAGYLTGRGDGTPEDQEKAVAYYKKAAELGNADAMTNLGIRYQSGRGTKKDMKQAAYWYQRGMDAGDLTANSGVGYMYRHGRGGYPKDPRRAVDAFRKAADKGNPSGQYNLGLMYEDGIGVGRDRKEAIRLFRLAARSDSRAQKRLEKLGLPLYDPAEIQRLLTELGYDPGPVDGKPGQMTRSAIRSFQQDRGRTADGEPDMALLEELRKAKKGTGAAQASSGTASKPAAADGGEADETEDKLDALEDALDF